MQTQNSKIVDLVSALFVMLFSWSYLAEAQEVKKIPRIGYLSNRVTPSPTTADRFEEAFRQGLRDLGYIEGKNILVEYRYAEGKQDRFPGLVAELLQLNVDVIVCATLPGIRAAKQATNTIPIVMVTPADPVATGLIESLARPGGNITGVTRLTRDLSGKRLELLKEAVPMILRVGVLGDESSPSTPTALKDYETAARALKIQLQFLEVRPPTPDFEGAFQTAVKRRVNALIALSGALSLDNAKRIADLAIKNRLPSMSENSGYAEAGGFISYSANDADNYKRVAYYVDKILKGTKPADLPVEQPMKFEFIINLKTAKQIGLTIPPNVLARADRVIR